MVQALRSAPEQFGALRMEGRKWLVLPDTGQARRNVAEYAERVGDALADIDRRPTGEEDHRAEEAVSARYARVTDARAAREAMGKTTAEEAVREGMHFHQAAHDLSGGRRHAVDQALRARLSMSGLTIVRGLMAAVRDADERQQTRSRSRGLDIG